MMTAHILKVTRSLISDSFAKVKSSRLSLSLVRKEMWRVKCYVSIVVDVDLKGVSHS